MNTSETSQSIVVVDDEPANLKLLEDVLRPKGYRVRSFPSGKLALRAVADDPPDLILLDVSMPDLSGYEVCTLLKSNIGLCEIPILFLSALNETRDKVRGFRAGGQDYITKPFQLEEIHARVETHLKVRTYQRALRLQNERLEVIVLSRTCELTDALRKLNALDRAKNDFLHIISHELRTPLNGLLGVAEIALDQLVGSAENDDLGRMFKRCRQRLMSVIEDALLLTEIDVSEDNTIVNSLISLSLVLNRAIDRTSEFAASRHVALPAPLSDMGFIRGEEALLVRALQALLETAVTFSKEGGVVRLSHKVGTHAPTITIESDGQTIPSSILEKFFEVFSISQDITRGEGCGLSPSVACRILALSGGTASVENLDPSGIRLTASF